MSDVVGVVNYGNTIVGPKSIESIIEIQNWPYQSTANTLSLVLGVATGSAQAQGGTLTSGSGNKQVYFSVANQATVSGQLQDVSLSGYTTGEFDTYFDDDDIQTQLSAAYTGEASVNVITVTFPAGASDIVYDPQVGVGQKPQNSFASPLVVRNVVLFACVVVLSLLL